jgi:hypothetical protein
MNKVRFEGRACILNGRTWSSEDPAAAAYLVPALNELTASLDGPGPAEGFVTLGAYLAPKVAKVHGGTVVELDASRVPRRTRPGTVY